MNVVSMNNPQHAAGGRFSILSLQFEVADNRPDWPVVRVLADGRDPFVAVAPGWRGFDPAKMLGPRSPFLPADQGRRVAVYCCSCGEPGCGVIAPVIVPSPDGRWVSWVDFRDYTGVFLGPDRRIDCDDEGRRWDLPDLHFDREQYIAEIERASADDSRETGRRRSETDERRRDAAPAGPHPATARSHHRIPRSDRTHPRTRTALTPDPGISSSVTAARDLVVGSDLFRRLGPRRVPALAGALCAGVSLRESERDLRIAW